MNQYLDIKPEVAEAIATGKPVVICPRTAARAMDRPETPKFSAVAESTGRTP